VIEMRRLDPLGNTPVKVTPLSAAAGNTAIAMSQKDENPTSHDVAI
jgi:hypothetical protein